MGPSTGEPRGQGAEPWIADQVARWAELLEDSVRVGAASAERWSQRSLEDGAWTVDTVTADVIADWEEMTPLAGRWLDLWLEAVQQGLRAGVRRGR